MLKMLELLYDWLGPNMRSRLRLFKESPMFELLRSFIKYLDQFLFNDPCC